MQQISMKAFLLSAPIALLGGLIGLGEAEFRLPLLMRVFDYSAKRAVPINLAVSLVTVVSAFSTRLALASVETVVTLLPLLVLFTAASMTGAYIGTGYVHRVHESTFEKIVASLLIFVGGVLIAESCIGFATHRVMEGGLANASLAVGLGGVIGLISSLLGVAGGELIIPTLMLVFGVDVKEAGTASLFISSATILIGLLRYWRQGCYQGEDFAGLVAPMWIGSVVGSVSGAAMIGLISAELLKALLGCILIVSSFKILFPTRTDSCRRPASPSN